MIAKALFVLTTFLVSLKFRAYGTGLIIITIYLIYSLGSGDGYSLDELVAFISVVILYLRLSAREMKAGRFIPDRDKHPVRAGIVRWVLIIGIACRIMITVLERLGYW